MRIIRLFLTISTILTLISCLDKQSFKVEFDSASGLTEKSKVVFKGQTIGEVDKIGFNDKGKIIVDLHIDKDFIMPKKYKFVIISVGILGSKTIELRELINTKTNSYGEINKGESESSNVLDSLPGKLINLIENAATNQSSKQDSILIELRRLNRNLEELKHNK